MREQHLIIQDVPHGCLASALYVMGALTFYASLTPLSQPHAEREDKLNGYGTMGLGLFFIGIATYMTLDWYRRRRDERIRNEDV